MKPLEITVQRPAEVEGDPPVTGGVPLPEGALPAGAELALLDDAGRAVPLQAEVLGTWDDGSAVRATGNPEDPPRVHHHARLPFGVRAAASLAGPRTHCSAQPERPESG